MAFYDLPGITLLSHSPQGIRVELNFDLDGLLVLWISPRATTSRDYRDRNFSNRDDHTRLFDRITLPGLSQEQFVKCDYDPFHVVAHFNEQVLHVVPLVDSPAVVLWTENKQRVELKTDKQDLPGAREARTFSTFHPDRGLRFEYVAALGEGGAFIHQPILDTGRSVYASTDLVPNQLLVIGGALKEEQKCNAYLALTENTPAQILAANEARVEELIRPGLFKLRDMPELQHLLNVNRRVLASMQDFSGAIRAALNRIYYLIWVRDGAIIEAFNGYAGNARALRDWTDFLLANPTVIEDPKHSGKTFLMLVNKITKWEEDGIFYAIWSAFTTWTQTGDASVISAERLTLLGEVMDWLERYGYDEERGLFGRYFYCETPLPGSYDDGFDGAVGKTVGTSDTNIDGKLVRRSYDIYINQQAYASYAMLAAMNKGGKARQYLDKARRIGEQMRSFFKADHSLPDYGDLLLEDGSIYRAGPYGLDTTDYVWALSIPPFSSEPVQMHAIRQHLFDSMMAKPGNYFLASWFSLLASLDLESFAEDDLHHAINYAAGQCYRPGKYLAMPNSVVEMTDMPDGHLWHDVRPQAFSVGPWLATMTGTGVRRLPFGLAVRANKTLNDITDYQYKGKELDFSFTGEGRHLQLSINGKPVIASLQLPETLLEADRNAIRIENTNEPPERPLLVHSTVSLNSVEISSNAVIYKAASYGLCQWSLTETEGWTFDLKDAAGETVPYRLETQGSHVWLLAEAFGDVSLELTQA